MNLPNSLTDRVLDWPMDDPSQICQIPLSLPLLTPLWVQKIVPQMDCPDNYTLLDLRDITETPRQETLFFGFHSLPRLCWSDCSFYCYNYYTTALSSQKTSWTSCHVVEITQSVVFIFYTSLLFLQSNRAYACFRHLWILENSANIIFENGFSSPKEPLTRGHCDLYSGTCNKQQPIWSRAKWLTCKCFSLELMTAWLVQVNDPLPKVAQ